MNMVSEMAENMFTLNLGGDIVSLHTPLVMGILNITPDSFYDGGKFNTEKEILNQAEKMLQEGASIIDIGGASSRPNAKEVTENEESKRAITAVKLLIKTFHDIKISIDTFRSKVAYEAVNEGAVMINDISGGELDDKMFETVAALHVPYILMHIKGNPQTMNQLSQYDDIVLEIAKYFHQKIISLKSSGIEDVILDLGFGFAKNIHQNFELLKKMPYFKELNLPLLVGVSRKSMIYKQLGVNVEESLNGTTVLNTIALMNGAKILRVHDVKPAVEAVHLYSKTFLEL